jgi:hypothetical protein
MSGTNVESMTVKRYRRGKYVVVTEKSLFLTSELTCGAVQRLWSDAQSPYSVCSSRRLGYNHCEDPAMVAGATPSGTPQAVRSKIPEERFSMKNKSKTMVVTATVMTLLMSLGALAAKPQSFKDWKTKNDGSDSWSKSHWVWDTADGAKKAQTNRSRYIRRRFELKTKPDKAQLELTVDNRYTAYINGQKIGSDGHWDSVDNYAVAAQLRAGANVIAVEARNGGGVAAAIFRLHATVGKATIVVGSDAEARVSTTKTQGWAKVGFDDSKWAAAKVLGDAGMAPWRIQFRTSFMDHLTKSLKARHPAAYHSLVTYRGFDKSGFFTGKYSEKTGRKVLERLNGAWLADEKDREEIRAALALPDSDSPKMVNVIGQVSERLTARAIKKTGKVAFVRRRSYGMRGTNATMFSRRTDRGSAICIYDPEDRSVKEIFKTEDGFIFDIHPSFDGKKLLMSYKEHYRAKGKSSFHIWEINVDGSGLKQLTDGPWHDFTPVYYPDGRIIFSSPRVESFSLCQNFLACALYVCREDGSDIRRFDWTALCTVSPALMPDGSIVVSRWEYQDKSIFAWQGLWTINPNGRQLKLYYGNTIVMPEALYGPKPIPDTDKLIYMMAAHHHPAITDIAIVDRKLGLENPKASRKITDSTPLGQPTVGKTWRQTRGGGDRIFPDAYSEPWPFCRELSVVSYGMARSLPAGLVLLDHGGTTYPLYRATDIKHGCYSPVTLSKRNKTRAIPGDCPQEAGVGTFFVQDVYQGLLAQGVKRGQVKKLRVYRHVPKKYNTEGLRVFDHYPIVGLGSYYVKEYYGAVPVDENGSAYFEAPSNVELHFSAIDKSGKEIQRMGSVTQITTGERVACIGCHEDRLNAPKADPRTMDRLKKPVDKIAPPSWGSGPVDYLKQVQPVWDKHCIKCHNGKEPKGGVDMTADRTRFFNMSFDSLCMRDSSRVGYFKDHTFIQSYFIGYGPSGVFPAMKTGSMVSKLTEMLEARHGKVQLTADEYDRIFAWIDANVPYYSTWDMTRPHTRGGRDLMVLPRGVKDKEFGEWKEVVDGFLATNKQRLTSASINFSNPE